MTDNAADLRAWAKGQYNLEAGTELLIRTGWAEPGLPWIRPTDAEDREDSSWSWIDFDAIPEHIGAYSSGEQRLLRIAASIGGDTTAVVLGDDVSGLDRSLLSLVLAAIAHAGGSHEHSEFDFDAPAPEGGTLIQEGRPVGIRRLGSLYPWPATDRRTREL